MNKMKRVCSALLCLMMVISMIPVMAVNAATAQDYTVQAAASQLRRMWSGQNYNSSDYVYKTELLFWGRVLYTRFLDTKGVEPDELGRVILRFEARTRVPGETIRAAALALSDSHAQTYAENNLKSATQTLKYFYKTADGQGSASTKMMTDKNGYYLSAVSNSIVAYKEFTASYTAVTDGTNWPDESRLLNYAYPVTIELDVTDTYRAAMKAGQNVQFVIMMPKDVFVNGTNLRNVANFGEYKNGTAYKKDGTVLFENAPTASLDTSGPVCGNAGYYLPLTKSDDDYFYWVYPLQDTIEVDVEIGSPEERFASVKAATNSVSDLPEALENLRYSLNQWTLYQKIDNKEALAQTLYQHLKSAATLQDFDAAFGETVIGGWKTAITSAQGVTNGLLPWSHLLDNWGLYQGIENKTAINQILYQLIQGAQTFNDFSAAFNEAIVRNYIEEITSANELPDGLAPLSHLLGEWERYQTLCHDTALNETLYQRLQQTDNFDAFAAAFDEAILTAYWQGYSLRLNVDNSFGGAKGRFSLEGENAPNFCYVQLEGYTASKKAFTETLMMRGGFAEYNIYDKKEGIVSLKAYATEDQAGKEPITGTLAQDVENVLLPGVFITELSNQHTITYFPDWPNYPDKTDKAVNRGEHRQKFQYIELYNYSDKTVDLTDHRFVYNDHKGSHAFEWILEEKGSLMLKPREVYVIGVYAADTVKEGLGYVTDAERTAYWDAFNKFYNCEIPVTNRVMIACVASGNATVMLDGIDHLERSKDAKVTCSAQIKKGDTVVTEVSLYENRPGESTAFQFVPTEEEGVQEEFLFVTGCFPGSLLKEQQIGHCEKPFANGTPMLRVSSYNILATEKSASDNYTNLEIEQREDLFVEYMKKYDIDIVGMQEVNYRWAPLLTEDMSKLGYSEVQGISGSGHTYSNASGIWDLMNPIYYKADKFKELERGHGFLTPSFPNNAVQWDSDNMRRTVTWVVLENKQTGEVVSFVNTHLVLSGKLARVEQVKLMYGKGVELQKKYGGSIVITGDHNMVENSEPYQAYINSGVVVDSKYETTNHNCIGTCSNGNVSTDEQYGATIDYVMVSKDFIVNKYYVHNGIVENGHLSDHAGLYVELYNSAYEDTDMPVVTGVTDGAEYCQKAVFTASDNNLASVTLNGEEITNPVNYQVLKTGEYTLKVTDVAGREVIVNFTIRNHEYEWKWDPEVTCNAPGKYVGTCGLCGETLSYTRPANGIHEKAEGDEGTVIKEPTCKEEGVRRFTCVNCQTTFDESIEKLTEHVWESEYTIDKKATCKEAGSKSIHCAACDTVKEGSAVVIDKLTTHTPGAWKTVKAATTKAEGLKEQRCKVCNVLLDSEVIPKKKEEAPKVNFVDVRKSDFFYTPVQWAVEQGITTGTSKTEFSPDASCTRAQAVTFLWRAAGQPAVKNAKNPFTDVKKSDYFYKAVLWAAENGVTSGTTKTTFAPEETCTRGQIVTFMWRALSGKKVNASNPFKDVKASDYYYNAVLWAVKSGATTGTSPTTFGPNENCTRGQIVTFLYRAMQK